MAEMAAGQSATAAGANPRQAPAKKKADETQRSSGRVRKIKSAARTPGEPPGAARSLIA
jgi:hypothetical protein